MAIFNSYFDITTGYMLKTQLPSCHQTLENPSSSVSSPATSMVHLGPWPSPDVLQRKLRWDAIAQGPNQPVARETSLFL